MNQKSWRELFEYIKIPVYASGVVVLGALMAVLLADDATGIGAVDDVLLVPIGKGMIELLTKIGGLLGSNPQLASAVSCDLS